MPDLIWLAPVFFLIAILYSSAGHGGASGYLALMLLTGTPPKDAASIALVLNLVVSALTFRSFMAAGARTDLERAKSEPRSPGKWGLRLLIPLATASVPAAFVGGALKLTGHLYGVVIAAALLVGAFRFLVIPVMNPSALVVKQPPTVALIGLGAVIGLLAGVTGIGGGIYLSPIVLLLGWAGTRENAAVSSGFIFLNSVSGLLARAVTGGSLPGASTILPLVLVVATGAVLGSYTGAFKLSSKALNRGLGCVLAVAAIGVIVTAFLP